MLVIKILEGVGGFPMITGRKSATIRLLNDFTARLSDVLMVPGMKTNLLSTQALRADLGIVSRQELHGYEFYKNNQLIAKGTHHGKASYLTWVKRPKALYGSKTTRETAYLAADRVVSAKTLHQQLGHPGKRRLIQMKNTVNFEVIDIEDLPKNCEICIKVKKIKIQQHSAATRAKHSLEHVFIDFWGPY